MHNIITVLKMASALLAAITLGNWFMSEVQQARRKGAPWYTPYRSAPGLIIILLCLAMPLIVWVIRY